MDFKDMTQSIISKPWAIVAALIVAFLLFRGSGSRAASPGFDPSATLQSQQITSAANVQLSTIGAGMYATDAERNARAVDAMKEISLGAQQFAAMNKSLDVQQAIETYKAGQNLTDSTNSLFASILQTMTGHQEAIKGLNNQTLAIQNQATADRLGFRLAEMGRENDFYALGTDRILGAATIDSNARQAAFETGADYDLGVRSINANTDLTKFSLPFEERMQLQEQETIRNLAWRAKQIAKLQANSSLFGSLISGGFGLASQGLGFLGK